MSLPKPLKIYFFSVEGVGHVNACVGFAQELQKRGHSITFFLNAAFQGQFVKFGFNEILLKADLPANEDEDCNDKPKENPILLMVKTLLENGFLGPKSPLEKMKDQLASNYNIFKDAFKTLPQFNAQIEKAIEEQPPDVFVVDSFTIPPAVLKAKLPWCFLCSAQPLCILPSKGVLPPYGAGFPTDSKPADWAEYMPVWREYRYKVFGGKFQEEINAMFNCTLDYELSDGDTLFANSPFLNIYGYPEELDYSDVFPLPDNFVRLDAFIREIPEPFELPKEVLEMPGEKLIYLSLGSLGSGHVELMKKITSALANKPQYKCIVSKGPLGDTYDLPSNCWGANFLPQTKILPLVDLVITHGGNNTVTETFSFGKPMIVMPLFGDQFDNAQRVHEKGYGIRLEPYSFTDSQLFEAMDRLLNDDKLKQRLDAAAERMSKSDTKAKVCQRVEKVVAEYNKH